jgi:hypothetical protein
VLRLRATICREGSFIGLLSVFVAWPGGVAGAQSDPAILQIRVVQGEGGVYAAGSRATHGVVVQVTDETGKPVESASVSFRLPENGPSGTFSSGGKTEIVNTNADGRAEVWGMQWGRATGSLELRITAAKGPTRGGVICPLYISDSAVLTPTKDRDPAPQHKVGGSKKKLWILVGAAAAASIAVVGIAASGGSAAAVAPGSVSTPPQIGNPTISISRP